MAVTPESVREYLLKQRQYFLDSLEDLQHPEKLSEHEKEEYEVLYKINGLEIGDTQAVKKKAEGLQNRADQLLPTVEVIGYPA